MQQPVVDHELLDQAESMRRRAASLRSQAEHLGRVLATSYRRRASELELEAFVLEVQSGVPTDRVHTAA
ncbi:MAG: hypothetical protein R2726_16200 [Acidimicrobiales bacterium]